ncbi:hypothetical protein [Alteromonas oceanisediminis]|uniref:hypothetical protein n=1 Tax=Alteromonas oceanisediminis TaxID=2836180 RepID=UPI001BD9662B|nr:hypothetical protein [Alteromonas oceanisediminis]MBT0586688.1 hypothetical protein [Alteromonas oceanisediminis]
MVKFIQAGAIALALTSGLLMASQSIESTAPVHSPIQDVVAKYQPLDYDLTNRDHFLRAQRIEHYLEKAKAHHNTKWYRQRDEALRLALSIIQHHQNSIDNPRSGKSL